MRDKMNEEIAYFIELTITEMRIGGYNLPLCLNRFDIMLQ